MKRNKLTTTMEIILIVICILIIMFLVGHYNNFKDGLGVLVFTVIATILFNDLITIKK